MMEETYIKLYRGILNWQWADNPNMLALWVRLLVLANYEDKEWHGISVKRGQVVTSITKLSESSGMTYKQVRACLDKLKEGSQIVSEWAGKFSIITICNYDSYQSSESCEGQAEGRQVGRQRAGRGQATKEDKEGQEEEKKEIIKEKKSFVPPTAIEVADYCKEIGSHIDVGYFMSYYEINGWKVQGKPMKNWKLAVQTWTAKDRSSRPELYKAPEQPKETSKWQTLKSIPKKQQ